jgi:hypothetical protein
LSIERTKSGLAFSTTVQVAVAPVSAKLDIMLAINNQHLATAMLYLHPLLPRDDARAAQAGASAVW